MLVRGTCSGVASNGIAISRSEAKQVVVQHIKFGDLLVQLNLVSAPDLNDALQVAPQFGLPLGRTLVLSGRLTEEELEVAVELQSMINQKKYSIEQAQKVAQMVRQGTPPSEALKGAGMDDAQEKTTLGQLLLLSKLINEEQLDHAQKTSYRSGMRLGRTLVLNGVISHNQLTKALGVQNMLRERKISMEQAIQMLTAGVPKRVALEANQMRPAPAQKRVRFSEFLVLCGLLTEAEMLEALETSMDKKLSLAQTIIQQGSISREMFDKSTELFNKVSVGAMSVNDATARVHRMVFGDPDQREGTPSPVLGELLKMTGMVNEDDIVEAISLSNKYPSLIGKMLVLSGAIDEATLIASLRCQFLLKHGYLKVNDAVTALQYSKNNKVSFDDALEELGLRKAVQHAPAD